MGSRPPDGMLLIIAYSIPSIENQPSQSSRGPWCHIPYEGGFSANDENLIRLDSNRILHQLFSVTILGHVPRQSLYPLVLWHC